MQKFLGTVFEHHHERTLFCSGLFLPDSLCDFGDILVNDCVVLRNAVGVGLKRPNDTTGFAFSAMCNKLTC